MHRKTLFAAVAVITSMSGVAFAEETTVIERGAPAVAVERPAVTIEKREAPAVVEKKTIETTGASDCRSKTVRKEDVAGSTTVHSEKCD